MINKNQQEDDTLSIEKMQNVLNEKSVASVVMGENGTVVVQFGDKVTIYPREKSAKLASKLLEVIADTQDG